MNSPSYAEAINEYVEMRAALGNQVGSASSRKERVSLATRVHQVTMFFLLGLKWLSYRIRFVKIRLPDAIFVYASGRTPRGEDEDKLDFLRRITRSNRKKTIIEHVDGNDSDWLCLQLSGLFSDDRDQSNSLDIITLALKLLGCRKALALSCAVLAAALSRRPISPLLAWHLIVLFSDAFGQRPTKLVISTSNSFMVECLRLAILLKDNGQVVEILHGIAATGMERYYDWIEGNSIARVGYVNLMQGLAQCESIERSLMTDDLGEIVINVQMWSSLGENDQLVFDTGFAEKMPIAFVGGWSAENDYLSTEFFEKEVEAIAELRAIAPDLDIYYCAHPQLNRQDKRLADFCDMYRVSISRKSTLAMTIHCAGSVGTFSTSIFEASLLEKPVLLLQYDDNIVRAELQSRTNITKVTEGLRGAIANFIEQVSMFSESSSPAKLQEIALQKLGLDIKIEPRSTGK